jgi:hypothetical protein
MACLDAHLYEIEYSYFFYINIYKVSNNNCYSWQKKILHKIFKTELYLFRFVLLTILTLGIHFKFKRLGFCNLLEHDIKVTKNHQNLLPTQSVLVAHTVLY